MAPREDRVTRIKAMGSKTKTTLTVAGIDLSISSPDKVYFPERAETKLDTIRYFLAVGEGVMRGLRGRPVALHRFPTGAGGKGFYNKRVPDKAPAWLHAASVRFPSARPGELLCPTNLAHVIWAVNRGGFELHPWPVVEPDFDHPTEMRIDLDPQPGCPPERLREVAVHCRELLTEHGLRAYPKLSGSRGIHLHVPISRGVYPFIDVRHACLAFARELERRHPEDATAAWWKEERGPRVFIDFNQNLRDKTIVAPYAVRPLPHAPVACPFTWDELFDIDQRELTIATVPARFAEQGDLLAAMDDDEGASIEPLLDRHRSQREQGLLDAPYPPHYPKQPGEPTRVAPSRAKKT